MKLYQYGPLAHVFNLLSSLDTNINVNWLTSEILAVSDGCHKWADLSIALPYSYTERLAIFEIHTRHGSRGYGSRTWSFCAVALLWTENISALLL
jgi:hypothetical protein